MKLPSFETIRRGASAVVLLCGAAYFLRVVGHHYAVREWIFWRYAGYWLACIFWSAACLSSGHVATKRLLGRVLPISEQLITSFAVGVYLFYLAMTVGGLLGAFHPFFFFALPTMMIAVGAVPLGRWLVRVQRGLRRARRTAKPVPAWVFPIMAFGLFGLLLVYVPILTPKNIAFDARWKHLAIAEHYAAQGGIHPFREGWWAGASPHLAATLYTWPFLLPASQLFDRVELAAHLEYIVFLWTVILGIPVLVRRVLPKHRIYATWAARLLFPGVLVYDSNVSGGADHIAALFAIPIFTALLSAYRRLEPRWCILLSLGLSGAFMTKYTGALLLVAFPILVVVVRSMVLVVRSLRGEKTYRRAFLFGPLASLLSGLALLAPHWLKNWVWYGDPMYPLFHHWLHDRPWGPDADNRFATYLKSALWPASHDLAGVKATLLAGLEFSFEPHDWARFHGTIPVIGSLFTLTLVALPFLRAPKRLWALFISAEFGVFIWFWTSHQDRYLQVLMPWMAAATAAALSLAWRSGIAARFAAGALVALQIVWGGDFYFFNANSMDGNPVKHVIDLLESGHHTPMKKRLETYPEWSNIAPHLPAGAKVVLHDAHRHLGIGAASVTDVPVDQAGIDYGSMKSARAVYDLMKAMGVTHVLWPSSSASGKDPLASDLRFYEFVDGVLVDQETVGGYTLGKMPAEPPPERDDSNVLVLGCDSNLPTGFYLLNDLVRPMTSPQHPYPPPRAPFVDLGASALRDVDIAVTDGKCRHEAIPGFTKAATRRPNIEIWLRHFAQPKKANPKAPATPVDEDEPTDAPH